MPQQMGRRAVRRLFRWHVATSSRTGPALATLAVAIVIVGAMVFEPGIMANAPYGSLHMASNAGTGNGVARAKDSADAVDLSDGLRRALADDAPTAPATSTGTPVVSGGYPPFGIAAAETPIPADDVILAALTLGVDKLAAVPAAIAPKQHTASVPARAPVSQVSAWKVAPIVTWYGPGFYGRRTACGQRYTRHLVGVASRTLACGTLVQFRWRGMTVVAPVIDRGPFASSAYVFDFSAAVACDLFRQHPNTNSCFTRHDVQWRVIERR